MGQYERMTAAGIREVLERAEQVLPARIPLKKVAGDHHSITLEGEDGKVKITAHGHGLETLVHAATDQVRTSRIDVETQYFMNDLPYQPADTLFQPGDAV